MGIQKGPELPGGGLPPPSCSAGQHIWPHDARLVLDWGQILLQVKLNTKKLV